MQNELTIPRYIGPVEMPLVVVAELLKRKFEVFLSMSKFGLIKKSALKLKRRVNMDSTNRTSFFHWPPRGETFYARYLLFISLAFVPRGAVLRSPANCYDEIGLTLPDSCMFKLT